MCFFCYPTKKTYDEHAACPRHEGEKLPPNWKNCDKHAYLEPDGKCSCWEKEE